MGNSRRVPTYRPGPYTLDEKSLEIDRTAGLRTDRFPHPNRREAARDYATDAERGRGIFIMKLFPG